MYQPSELSNRHWPVLTVGKLTKLSIYFLITGFVVALSVELLLRLAFADPDYYWNNRFLFVSPSVYQNRADRFWTYRPHVSIREVALYGFPEPLTKPRIFVEYDCIMKSNNLGLLQDNDIEIGSAATIIVGDSFTAGQGGCPWFGRLQTRRNSDHLVNAGLMGTGFGQWMRLIQYLREQGIMVKRLLVIAISEDFKRTTWVWRQDQLDCLDHGICPEQQDHPLWWRPLEELESTSHVLQRSAVRFSTRFGHLRWPELWKEYFWRNFYLPKFLTRAIENLTAHTKRGPATGTGSSFPKETEEALEWFKSLRIPLHVLLVNRRDEVRPFGTQHELQSAVALLNAHGVSYSRCDLSKRDFMAYDGHPNRLGYEKLISCVDNVLDAM